MRPKSKTTDEAIRREMELINAIRKTDALTCYEKIIARELIDCASFVASHEWAVADTQVELAANCGISRSSFIRHLKGLLAKGLFIQEKAPSNHGEWAHSIYIAQPEAILALHRATKSSIDACAT